MKKFLMMAAMAVISLTASAQAWVGGSLNYNVTSRTSLKPLHALEVKSEFGWALSDKYAMGMKLGYKTCDNERMGLKDYEDVSFSTAYLDENRPEVAYDVFIINPFFRYNFYRKGLLTFYVDGGFCYTTRVKKIFVGINPGVKYDLTSKWSVSAEIGKLGWTHYVSDVRNHQGNFKLGGDLCLGLQYHF